MRWGYLAYLGKKRKSGHPLYREVILNAFLLVTVKVLNS